MSDLDEIMISTFTPLASASFRASRIECVGTKWIGLQSVCSVGPTVWMLHKSSAFLWNGCGARSTIAMLFYQIWLCLLRIGDNKQLL